MPKTFIRMKQTLFISLVLTVLRPVICSISISTHDVDLRINDKFDFNITVSNFTNSNATLQFTSQHSDIVKVEPPLQRINATNRTDVYPFKIVALGAGNSEVYSNISNSNASVDNIFLRVTVHKINALDTISVVIGWIYFAAWGVSFYPQIYENFVRKSVVGLNFDFLALNLVGFSLYSIFNLGLYLIPEIRKEYSHRYPRGLNPVKVNDIFFSIHAAFATILTIIQCYIYERNDQRVSHTARIIMGAFAAFLSISMVLCFFSVLHWIDFLYFCSYVKLTITLIKYIPQAYMNYKRKSTVGWSIGNVLLDFTGGILSMLQMLINAYNYDDWVSIFGDPTKFGLGLFSVLFDVLFFVQHYVLYKDMSYNSNETL